MPKRIIDVPQETIDYWNNHEAEGELLVVTSALRKSISLTDNDKAYTKDEVISLLEDIKTTIRNRSVPDDYEEVFEGSAYAMAQIDDCKIILEYIDDLKGGKK